MYLLKKEDCKEIYKILGENNLTSVERHNKIYKCLLKIVKTNDQEEGCLPLKISKIRNYISKRERQTLFRTIKNTSIYYIILFITQILRKYYFPKHQ